MGENSFRVRNAANRGIENGKVDQFCRLFYTEAKKVIHVDKKAALETGSWDAPEVIWQGQGGEGLTGLNKRTVFLSGTLQCQKSTPGL